jgi:hypothetical protein
VIAGSDDDALHAGGLPARCRARIAQGEVAMARRYHAPCDPECPTYARFISSLFNDPMTAAMGAPTDEIVEGFERKHRIECERCCE